MGVGAKMFTIAGPVIVCGVSVSVVYGLIYWIRHYENCKCLRPRGDRPAENTVVFAGEKEAYKFQIVEQIEAAATDDVGGGCLVSIMSVLGGVFVSTASRIWQSLIYNAGSER